MCHNWNAIATVLGLKDLLDVLRVRIKYDSAVKRVFIGEYEKKVFEFVQCTHRLYYHDTKKTLNNKHKVDNYSGVQSVHNNKEMYAKKYLDAAKKITDLQ